MSIILKLRTDDRAGWASFVDEDFQVGEEFTWGVVGGTYRSAGDVKFVRDGGLRVGEKVLVRERRTATDVRFPALVQVIEYERPDSDSWVPVYRVLERFDGSPTLADLKRTNPRVAAFPQFQKNAKGGFMLRSFVEMDPKDFAYLVSMLRRSSNSTRPKR